MPKVSPARGLPPTSIWTRPPLSWLVSLRVGISLLVAVTLASIAGTLIGPITEGDEVIVSALVRSQQIVFYSWWFLLLLALLATSIACTTWRTVTMKVLPSYKPRFMRAPNFYDTAIPRDSVPFTGAADGVAAEFRRSRFAVWTDGRFGYAVRGRLALWGAPVAHVGVVMVLLGGFASAWLAREVRVAIPEGGAASETFVGNSGVEPEPLGFTIHCDDFDTAFFPRTRTPSRFTSTVGIDRPGHSPESGIVEVNRSMKVNGWMLHQTSYQEMEGQARWQLAVANPSTGLATTTLELSPGQARDIPGAPGYRLALGQGAPPTWSILHNDHAHQQGTLGDTNGPLTLVAERFEPDFVIGPNRQITSRSANLDNPALRISLYAGETPVLQRWLFGSAEMKKMMHAGDGPWSAELLGVTGTAEARAFRVAVRGAGNVPIAEVEIPLGATLPLARPETAIAAAAPAGPWSVGAAGQVPAYATFLTLTRNPTIPFIYFGCALMVLGCITAFAVRRREVWFMVDAPAGALRVAAFERHPQPELDTATRAVLDRLSGRSAAGGTRSTLAATAAAVTLAAFLAAAPAPLGAAPPAGPAWEEALDPLLSMPVQDSGFIRSGWTFGENALQAIAGRARWEGLDPLAATLWLIADLEARSSEALVKVDRPELGRLLGGKRVSLATARSESARAGMMSLLQRDQQQWLDPLNELEGKLQALEHVEHSFAIIPRPGEWASPADLGPDATEEERAIAARYGELKAAILADDAAAGGEAAAALAAQVRDLAARRSIELPPLGADLFYHRHAPFAKSAVFYLFAALAFGACLLITRRIRLLYIAGIALLSIGFLEQLAGIVLRWIIAGRAPLSNMYESFTFAVAGLVLFAIFFELRARTRLAGLGGAVLGFIFMVLAHKAPIFDSQIRPLMPALQSSWLTYHVVTIMLSYSAFALSAFISAVYLVKSAIGGDATPLAPLRRIPSLDALDLFNYRIIAVGFPLLTIGIILGAVWAATAWGRPWGFDPKETWSAVTWMIYAIYLHVRYLGGWRGRRASWLALLGFAAVLFTYLGVNYLLPGLHSYA